MNQELTKNKELLSDKEAEVRIMKRERDEMIT